jgi:hypothetical protein
VADPTENTLRVIGPDDMAHDPGFTNPGDGYRFHMFPAGVLVPEAAAAQTVAAGETETLWSLTATDPTRIRGFVGFGDRDALFVLWINGIRCVPKRLDYSNREPMAILPVAFLLLATQQARLDVTNLGSSSGEFSATIFKEQ